MADDVRAAVDGFSKECTNLTLLPLDYLEVDTAIADKVFDEKMRRMNLAVEAIMQVLGESIRHALTWERTPAG